MTTGPNDLGWDELIQTMTARAALVAADGTAETYGVAVAGVQREHPQLEVPTFGGLLGQLLFYVVHLGWEFDPAMPVLSAVFHSKEGNEPAPGYYDLVRSERPARPQIEPEWTRELGRCHQYFRQNRQALPRLLRYVDRIGASR